MLLNSGNWSDRRSDGAGEAKRRGGEEKAGSVLGLEMVSEIGEVPEFSKVDSEAEEAAVVEGKMVAVVVFRQGVGCGLDGDGVGGDGGNTAVFDPLQQFLIPSVQNRASLFDGGIGSAIGLKDEAVESGPETEDVAGFDGDVLLFENSH